MPKPRPLLCLFAVAGLLLAGPALAGTWQWRDASGRMVYSDLPPPPSVPASQILRAPTPATPAEQSTAAPAPAAGQPTAAARAPAAAAPAAAASRSWAEKEQDFRKRAAEREEAERKQREEREQTARAARACQDARSALRTLESGMRVSTIDANGERHVIDEAERARRIDAARQEIGRSCAKPG
ncbi:MAG TPA: DUF4124 domain-containing protein [Burkholderiaceae bacterium]|jgi:hypothetical protein|nr:DUF4124 domain-containing protein [Burkholderiaceae bacterium]